MRYSESVKIEKDHLAAMKKAVKKVRRLGYRISIDTYAAANNLVEVKINYAKTKALLLAGTWFKQYLSIQAGNIRLIY
jgi:hypothetical protein